MKPWSLPILAAIALSSCDRQSRISHAAAPAPAPLPVVAEAEVPAPANPTVSVEPGMDLGTIAEKAYGHSKFSGFVARLNGMTDPQKLPAGALLKTPSLPIAFREAGLDRYPGSAQTEADGFLRFTSDSYIGGSYGTRPAITTRKQARS